MDTSGNIRVLDWAADFDREPSPASSEFTQTDAQLTPLAANEEPPTNTNSLPAVILASQGKMAEAGISTRMYDDLVRLANRGDGWRGPGSKSLQLTSLNNFLNFWAKIRDEASEPELALAPDGAIHAEWNASPQRRLDVRFSGDRMIFGLLTSKSIIEGADKADIIAKILRSHYAKPLLWRGG